MDVDWAFPEALQPSDSDVGFDLEAALNAMVLLEATVPEDAFTARGLGTERAGYGAVIDDDGLIVTIGYLILEASQVQVRIAEDTAVAAEILAYDHETGFGLLRASEPLDVTPMRLGTSANLAQGDQLLVAGFGGPPVARAALLVSRRDFAGYWEYLLEDAIFTSPPYPHFGGAALIDAGGELVGIGSLAVADAYDGEQPLPPFNAWLAAPPTDRIRRRCWRLGARSA